MSVAAHQCLIPGVPPPSGPTPKDCCRSADRAWKRVGSLLGTQNVCESGIGSLAWERAYGLSSRGGPRPQVRRGAADWRARPARAREAVPPDGALVRGTGGREPPLRRSEAEVEPRLVWGDAARAGSPWWRRLGAAIVLRE
ncbi:hypothetical protein NDU88_004281 [Pleurodeles waltl]|uniref:Uncharacterized protein n=1 Tax=Pleurodeles waltl TaxID=8319 RepID=A0AAV7W8L8_PLEWA|nr:hypothetical protein NDU88_004281 [Pleurodeles waltl]